MNEELYKLLQDNGINTPENMEEFDTMLEDEETVKQIETFLFNKGIDMPSISKKKTLFSESPSQEDSLDTESEEYSYLDNLFGSLKRGWARGSAAEEATDVLNPLAEIDYNQIAQAEKSLVRLEKNKSKVLSEFQKKGFGNFRFLLSAPEQIMEVLGMMGRTLFSDKAISSGVTAGGAAAITGVGAIPIALGSTMVSSSFVSEFGSTLLDTIREQTNEDGTSKYDLKNTRDVIRAFADEDVLKEAKKNGLERGIPVAMLDALTMKASSLAVKTLKGSKSKLLGGLAVESTGGALGETAAQIVDKGKIHDNQSILLEGLLEVTGGTPVVLYNMYAAEKMNSAENFDINNKIEDINNRISLEEDADVKKELIDYKSKLVKKKNKLNKDLADVFSDSNVEERNNIQKLNESVEKKREALGKAVDDKTKAIIEEDIKNTTEEIKFRNTLLKENTRKEKYHGIGKKVKNNEKLTQEEQDIYDKESFDVESIYDFVENEKKVKEQKKVEEFNKPIEEETKNFFNKIYDVVGQYNPFNLNQDKTRALNRLEEIKEGNIENHRMLATARFEEFSKILQKTKPQLDENVFSDFNEKLVAYAQQEEINGVVFDEKNLTNYLSDLKQNNGVDINIPETIKTIDNMMMDVESLSQMILDNQNYQKVYSEKTTQENEIIEKKLNDLREQIDGIETIESVVDNIDDLSKTKILKGNINNIRKSIRAKSRGTDKYGEKYDEMTIEILDAISKGETDVMGFDPMQMEILIEDGISYGNLANMLLEDGIFETKSEALFYLSNIKTKEKVTINQKDPKKIKELNDKIKNLEKEKYISPLQVIEKNLGKYLTRSYRFFSDKKNFTFDETRGEATKLAHKKFYESLKKDFQLENNRVANTKELGEISLEAEKKARETINQIESYLENDPNQINRKLNDGISFENVEFVINESVTNQINKIYEDTGILQKRKDLDQVLRVFLGEYKDLGAKYVNSIDKLTRLNYEQVFYEGVLDTYSGDMVFDDLPKEGNFVRYKTDNPANPLNNKYVHEDIHNVLDFVDKELNPGYTKVLGLMRKSKTVWNLPNSRKNITGNLMAMIQNGYFIKKDSGYVYNSMKLINESMNTLLRGNKITPYMKDLFNRGSKQGLTSQSIGLNNLLESGPLFMDMINDDSSMSKRPLSFAKEKIVNLDKRLKTFYGRVDDFSKIVAFDMESKLKARQEFGVEYDQLTDKQKLFIDKAAGEKVKNTFPTWSRIPNWYKRGFMTKKTDNLLKKTFKTLGNVTITKQGILGDFVPFKLETLRTYGNSLNEIKNTGLKLKEINSLLNKETDSSKIEILKERKKAYLEEYKRRLTGSLTIAGSQAMLKTAVPVMLMSSIKQSIDKDDKEKEETLKKAKHSYNVIRKFYPDWMSGHTLLGDYDNMKFNKEKDRFEIDTFDYSLENPYSLVLDPVFNILKSDLHESNTNDLIGELYDVVEPNMLMKTLTELFSKKDVYGRDIDSRTLYALKSITPPSLMQFVREFDDIKTGKKGSAETIRELFLIRDYKFSPDQQYSFMLKDFSEKKSKEELLKLRDLYLSSLKFSRLQKNSFSSQLRKIINKSRLSKDEKEFLVKGSGLSLINYEEE